MKKKWKWLFGVLVIIVIVVLVAKSCKKGAVNKGKQAVTEEVHTVARGKISSQIQILGEVQPQTVVAVKSKVSGTIKRYYADENEYVRAGQIIADIEPDFNQANTLFNTKSQLGLAKQALDLAVKNEAEKKILLNQKVVTQKDYDAASEELDRARIEYTRSQAQYDMISDLDTDSKVTHVYATASGIVIERKINVGEMVVSSTSGYGEGTVVMKIADLNKMIVKSNINEVDINKFKLGQEARITLDALPYEEFVGKIIKIAPMAILDNNARVFPVEISINSGGEKTKPGMTANISIFGESRDDVIVIPIRAVFSDDKNQDIVYVMPKTCKAQDTAAKTEFKGVSTPVKLGANDLQMVEVISGLKEGDQISLASPVPTQNFNFGM
ncbi:MAG: efflux RND transporter periplasmic adaptor subunit [Candidatus Cloacimonetes bacterium]|nr:efflux RND transporter periplasmic adaptor subunit [Candidatus Cloacimonadota bacterium]